jgi:hypothetical protein
MAKLNKREAKAKSAMKKVQVTLGDLIAAAYETAGTMKGAARVLSSRHLAAAIHRRIVLV